MRYIKKKIEIFFPLFICVLFVMLELHPRLFMCWADKEGVIPIEWHTPVVLALRIQRREGRHKFKAGLVYWGNLFWISLVCLVSSRLAWGTQ